MPNPGKSGFTVYVRSRGGILTLFRRLPSLGHADAVIASMCKDRLAGDHDVFIVNEVTGETIEPRSRRAEDPPARPPCTAPASDPECPD
jgi:hypothetical protein